MGLACTYWLEVSELVGQQDFSRIAVIHQHLPSENAPNINLNLCLAASSSTELPSTGLYCSY